MNRSFPGRTFFVSAYLILAIGFLTIHFTRVENFSAVVGGISVKGRSSVGTAMSPPTIRRINLKASGLEMNLRKGDKAVIITDDGIRHPLEIVDWEIGEDMVKVGLSDGAGFTLQADPHSAGLRLIPTIPATLPPVRSLELPFRPDGNAQIGLAANRPNNLTISVDGSAYVATLPSDSSWDASSGRLNLVVLDKADPILEVSDDRRGGDITALAWLEEGSAPSGGIYDRAVAQWMDVVREGWRSRLDTRLGLWLDAKGDPGWSDLLAAAVLADSVENETLPASLQSVTSVADRAPKDIGWLPSPYLGNIVNQSRIHAQQMRVSAERVRSGLAAGDPPFGIPNSITSLIASGFSDTAAELVLAAGILPEAPLSNQNVIERIALLQEARDLEIGDEENTTRSAKRLIEERLLPKIYWVKDGLWLVEDDGSVNLALSILTGNLLMREAQHTNVSSYQSIGRQMIVSAIAYTDEEGLIPANLLFESSGEVVKNGAIVPEELYGSIIEAPAYPRHVSLAKDLGPGSWAITSAEKFTVRSTPRETTLTMDFPAGSIHHLAIQGVKSFNVLYMNGIKWNGDPNFQRYYAGWSYDENTETLYIKIRHRVKTETIRILYYDPEEPAIEEAPPPEA